MRTSRATFIVSLLVITTPGRTSAQYPAASNRAVVVGLSAAYIASALSGTHIAFRDNLPERCLGIDFHRSVRSDFYTGGGTAFSPGLPMLLVQAVVTGMTAGPAMTSRKATHALAVGGVLYSAGQLCEPMTYRVLAHPRTAPRDRLAVVVSNIVVPTGMAVAAVRALR
jgi:hypothetical protein